MTTRKLLSALLVIAMLTATLSFGAKAVSSNDQIVTNQQIIQAAQALINAEAQYYDISSVAVHDIIEMPQADGTTNLQCNLAFHVRLKAKSVEELPYVAGLLNGIGMTSLNECLALEEAASQAVTRTTAIGGIGYIDESAVIASRASTFISSVAENIGVENEIYFPVLLKVSASGTINNIWGYQAGCTFPLSDYFPGSAAQLYQNGNCHAAAIVANAGSIANEINAVTMILYYRVDARNYANRYTSNATTCYGGSRYPMDPTYYNPNYTFHVGKDCANFVSQAIHYGGIPKTATWTPGASAWSVVGSLVDYFASTSPMIYEANFDTCVAGGFIVTVGSGGSREHVVMCVQNDTVTHCYSAHTQDVLKAVYTSSYPGKEGKSAKYYNFVYTTTETQYADGRLD